MCLVTKISDAQKSQVTQTQAWSSEEAAGLRGVVVVDQQESRAEGLVQTES